VASHRFERHASEVVQQGEWAELEPNRLIDSSQVESKLVLPLALSPRLTSRGHLPDGVGSRGLCTLGTIGARNQLKNPSLSGAHCKVGCGQVRAPAADRSVQNEVPFGQLHSSDNDELDCSRLLRTLPLCVPSCLHAISQNWASVSV
jgi:hypothetical protein